MKSVKSDNTVVDSPPRGKLWQDFQRLKKYFYT